MLKECGNSDPENNKLTTNNALTIHKASVWKLLLPILVGCIIGLITEGENILFLGVLAGLVLFILFVRKPELPLAILFNGTFIYFYLAYKMSFETSTLLTGGFYALLALSFLLGGILLVAKRPQIFRLEFTDVLFISFFFLVFLSYFMFHTGSESAYKKISYAPLLVIAPYFGIRLLSSKERIEKFFNYCVFVASILIIPAFYELSFNLFFSETGRFAMFEEKGNNPILFGITFAILLIILFIWVLEQKKLKFKYLILIVPSMFLLLRSGSRGAVISFFITIILYIFIIARVGLKTKVYSVILIALLSLVVYKFIPETLIEYYQYSLTPEARIDEVSSIFQRITMWTEAINDFKTNPIFGVGVGNSVGGIGFPHNIILEVSAELGILGIFMFLSMCYLTVKKAIVFIKQEEKQDLNLLMKLSFVLFVYSLTEAMFSGYITNQTQLFMSMGLVVSLINLKQIRVSSQGKQIKT